jgi:hypothetical protein
VGIESLHERFVGLEWITRDYGVGVGVEVDQCDRFPLSAGGLCVIALEAQIGHAGLLPQAAG